MARLFEDLRFFIGAFFLIVGAMLMIQGLVNPVEIAGLNPNLISGVCFFIFGALAMTLACLAYRALPKRPEVD
jgi:Kef-type K+ transport system membrane component KefB